MRESGFDTTFRFGPFSGSTTDYPPVGLNSLLYRYALDLKRFASRLGLAVRGLEAYGYDRDARRIAGKFIATAPTGQPAEAREPGGDAGGRNAVWCVPFGGLRMTATVRRESARFPALRLAASGLLLVCLAAASPGAPAQALQPAAQVPPSAANARASGGPLPQAALAGLRWRLVGPFRGGWATMAAGVPQHPNTYYIGTAGGGVWKTVDAGRTWHAVGNTLPPSIGAIAVAPSAPDTIYVGTGQVAPRYDIGVGHGVFKSTDGGKTWQSLGLGSTRYVGRIWVDPDNANVVLVAAMGHLYGSSAQRGIYRSTDGGKTWRHVLFINDRTGVVDLAADPTNPKLLYAAAWQMRDWPWLDYFEPHGGRGSGIYRSTDGGKHWTRLSGGGWPQGPLGRIGLAVTHTAQGARIYAAVDSATQGGVWRSDDGGNHWQRVNDDEDVFGNWYFARLTADLRNPDTVYSAGQSIRRSTDGGRTWHIIKGAPGGDDYHFLWINPLHPDHWITASDQGAVVTVDDGRSWSSWYNQPTGQFYHLAVDNRFPYWIYSGQQDSGTVGAASRSDYGSLTFRDWHPVGGDERDYMVPDPDDANLVFGSGLGGRVSRWDAHTGQVANVSPYPVNSYGADPLQVKYRYGWVTPLVFTPTKPHALLLGAQLLFRSSDLGETWRIISPDLTGAVAGTPGCSKAATGALARKCGFGVISAIEPSPVNEGEIWVGTDSGLIQLTRDGGRHWRNVTPPTLAPWEKVSALSASSLDPATAYAAVDDQRRSDYRPHVFRTHDYGRTWREIDTGLPPGQPVTAVESDPLRAGLLYAGTIRGAFVSFDDGGHWQSLSLNLPNVRVSDLLVHDNDLIASTVGRAIWVLDDVTPLRQLSSAVLAAPAHLFAPEVAYRVHPNNNRDTPLPPGTPQGQNPPAGALIDYWLGAGAHGPVTLALYDAKGRLVRSFSSDEKPRHIHADRYFTADWLKPAERLSASPGMHRFAWNLRYQRPQAVSYEYSMAAVFGEDTPTAVDGPFVLPGSYRIVMTVDGQSYTAPLVVKLDPRVHVSTADLRSLLSFSQTADSGLARVRTLYDAKKLAHLALKKLAVGIKAGPGPHTLLPRIERLSAATRDQGSKSLGSLSTQLGALEADAESADVAPTAAQQAALAASVKSLDELEGQWKGSVAELHKLNQALRRAGLPTVSAGE